MLVKCCPVLLVVLALGVVLVSGCGGGGGGTTGGVPGPAVDGTNAMTAPLPTSQGTPSSNNVANLQAWETLANANAPITAIVLATQVGTFSQAVNASPNDPAAQVGLSLSLLATAGLNSVTYIGYNPIEPADVQSVAKLARSSQLDPAQIATDAMKVARCQGVPTIPSGTSSKKAAKALTSYDLQQYQQALKLVVLPLVTNAIDRFTALGATTPVATRILSLSLGDGRLDFYPADFRAIAGGLRCLKAALQTLVAPNLNYGSYDWGVDITTRDANHNGIITVAEYAPPAPFANIDATLWTGVGSLLRDAIADEKWAFTNRGASVNSVISQILEGESLTLTQAKLNEAQTLLTSQVTVNVDCYNWVSGAWKKIKTVSVPMKLRELWDTPPASFRALLPQLYTMLDHGIYGGGPISSADEDFFGGTVVYGIGTQRSTVVIGPAPHLIKGGSGATAFSLTAPWNWANITGTYHGSAVNQAGSSLQLNATPKYADLPDKTFSGVFPTPDVIGTIYTPNYRRLTYRYGHFTMDTRQ